MHRTTLLFFAVVLSICNAALADDLAGRVTDAKGQPIGGATVIITSAEPRVGAPTRCATCYDDCGRTAKTDPNGQYVLLEVDPWLVFSMAAMADGHRARLEPKADPAPGKPINFALEPLPEKLPPECRVRGRVVDAEGKPIAFALVTPFGRKTADSHDQGAMERYGIDALAVTNSAGEFLMTARDPAEAYDLDVKAPRHAPKRFNLIPVGDEVDQHKLAVDVGATVSGRLVKEGKPVAAVLVVITAADRNNGEFSDGFSIATDEAGRFAFQNLPAGINFHVYTMMNFSRGEGALRVRAIRAPVSAAVRDLGDLTLEAVHSISGRIVMADGKKPPGKHTVSLRREWARDNANTTTGADGAFHFDNVPHDESVTIYARIPGYRLVESQLRFQQVRENSIALHVDAPRNDVELVYELDPAGN